jgi:serine phosphatase RsbU (regulator of sigma subunit)/tetratricopeptide (TPR) repeat protein
MGLPAPAPTPTRIGGYTLEMCLSRSNLSEVWVASRSDGSRACVKRMLPVGGVVSIAAKLGFKREAELLAQVQHPHIVRVLEVGESLDGAPFIALELVVGQTLSSRLSAAPFPLVEALEILRQVSEGLAQAHEKNIVHADLKPANILLEGQGGSLCVKIVDFGLASEVGSRASSLSGTPAYMAPEQTTLVDWPIDARSDLYALGVIAFEMLTGQLPFTDDDPAALLFAHVAREPPRPTSLNPAIPPIVEAIVMMLLEKNPARRYRTARSLEHDLKHVLTRLRSNDPSPTFVLDALDDAAERIGSVFIGRSQELGELSAFLDRARQGRPGIVFVGGVAGVGKSCLLREFRNASVVSGARFASGKCYEFARALPYHVVAQALADFLKGVQSSAPSARDAAIATIREAVGDLGAELVKIAPQFVEVFPDAKRSEYLGEGRDRLRFLQMLTSLLERAAPVGEPLVLLLDDLQWADSGTFQVLSALLDVVREGSLLVLATYRSEEVGPDHPLRLLLPKGERGGSRGHIELRPLDRGETSVLLGESLRQPVSILPSSFVELVFERTSGNPLFIAEVLKALLAEGAVVVRSGELSIDETKLAKTTLPRTVVDVVLRRLVDLDPLTRRVLGVSSLIGLGFTLELLMRVTRLPPDDVYAALQKAIEQRLLSPPRDHIYRFIHDRLQEACAGLIEIDERPSVHAQILTALEDRQPDGLVDDVFDRAEHAIRAGDAARAWRYCQAAGRQALAQHANQQALDLLMRALECSKDVPDANNADVLAVRAQVGELLTLLGRYDEAVVIYNSLLDEEHRPYERAVLLSQLAANRQRAGNSQHAATICAEALSLLGIRLRQRGFELAEQWARLRATAARLVYRPSASRELSRERLLILEILSRLWLIYFVTDNRRVPYVAYLLVAEAAKLGPSKELSRGERQLALSLVLRPRPAWSASLKHGRRAVDAALTVHAQLEAAISRLYTADVFVWSARYLESLPYLESAREALTALGNVWELANTHVFSFLAFRATGRLDDAYMHAESILKIGQRANAMGTIANGHQKMADILFLKGDFARGETHLRESLEIAEKNRLNMERFGGYKIQGLARLQEGRFAEARSAFQAAIKICETPGISFVQFYLSDAYFGYAEAFLRDSDFYASSGGLESDEGRRVIRMVEERVRRERHLLQHLAQGLRARGLIRWRQGRIPSARRLFTSALRLLNEQGRHLDAAFTETMAAEVLGARFPDEAKQWLHRARVTAEGRGARPLHARTTQLLRAQGEQLIEGVTSDDRTVRALKDMVLTSRLLIQSHDPVVLLESIVESSLRLLGAERGFLFIRQEDGGPLELVVGKNATGDRIPEGNANVSRGVVERVDRSGEGLAVSDAQDDESLKDRKSVATFGLRSIVCAPLRHAGQPIGVLYIDSQLTRAVLGGADLELLELFVAQAAIALVNARNFQSVQDINRELDTKVLQRTRELEAAYTRLDSSMVELKSTTLRLAEAKREALEKELDLARDVQLRMVPKPMAHELPLARLAGLLRPASRCGGDLWTFQKGHDTRLLLIVADVTGHGLGSAMITTVAKSCVDTLWSQSQGMIPLAQIFSALNDAICDSGDGELMMTAFGIDVDASVGTVRYCSAAHCPQIYVKRGHGAASVTTLARPGFRLGDQRGAAFEVVEIPLVRGDRLVMFTDGVIEQTNAAGTQYGLRRLTQAVKTTLELDVLAAREAVVADVDRFADGALQEDDLTIVVADLL